MLKAGRSIIISKADGSVKITENRVIYATTLEKFRKAISLGTLETPVLPFGTVMARYKGKWSALFIQQPPRIRNVQYKPREGKPKVFTLAFPWMVFGLRFMGNGCVDVYSGAAKAPIISPRSELVALPLPNSDTAGKRCMGPEFGMTVNTGSSVTEVAMAVMAYFDGSTYNDDLPANVSKLPVEFGRNETTNVEGALAAWERWTETAGKKWGDIVNVGFHPTESFGAFAARLPI